MISHKVSFYRYFLFLIPLIFLIYLAPSYATVYRMPAPGDDVVGQVEVVRSGQGDTLLTIANRYNIGMHEILEANQKLHRDQYSASEPLSYGTRVVVPTQYVLPAYRKGIVINLAELRLYYFSSDEHYVYTYPVGLGRMDWRTPLTTTTVIRKSPNPTWYPPKDIKEFVYEETGRVLPDAIPPGEENPLGPYAMYLGHNGYLIHGTNQPWSIGKYISSGCIRMHNEDVTELYPHVAVGTPVRIINYSNKAGWSNGTLYLEAQIPLELNYPEGPLNQNTLSAAVNQATKKHAARIDWNKAEETLEEQEGIPKPIGEAYPSSHQAFLEDN
jgi:L,D-transpeptidase ErfK/SrfK